MEKYDPSSFAKATEDKQKNYNPLEIERKWQKKWEEDKLYEAKDFDTREKFYCLDMFPYPSGEGLHVGHWRGFVLSDMYARFQMLNGKNVLHPMGWDAFGLPAENAAIKNKSHPKIYTDEATKNFKRQLKQIGASFDWSREINTSDPEYYKWTQWLFLKLYENGLAYRKNAPVNWCPGCQTVLANEQVVAGECERCGTKVVKKDLTQWFFKITDFAEDLLNDLDDLDWPERTKTLQRNWIGKSIGATVEFKVDQSNEVVEVFTTRPDTLFGVTFIVLAPEHPMIEKLKAGNSSTKEIDKYINKVKNETDIERESKEKKKTGVFTGIYAINPINNKKIPIWISDYVLMSYGTGACMCVPAHDERDFQFAKKFGLPINIVICPNYPAPICPVLDKAFEKKGFLIESGEFVGMPSDKAKVEITRWLEINNLGKSSVNYRLRDWLISRQRYWGAPIPIIYCEKCGEVPVPEKDLPVILPEDVEFKPQGDSPLKQSDMFLNTICPKCGGKAIRETDTMDTFVDSSWYYLFYCDPHNDKIFNSSTSFKKALIKPSQKDLDYISEFKLIYSDFDSDDIKAWTTNRFMLNGLNGGLWLPLRTVSFMIKEKDVTHVEKYIQDRGYKIEAKYPYGNVYTKDGVRFEYIKVIEKNGKLISYTERGAPQEMKKEDLPDQILGQLDGFKYRVVNPAYNLAHYKFIQKYEGETRTSLGDKEKIEFLEKYLESDKNKKMKYWLPVDLYIGGVEHAILHLLYARFISKALHKLKIIDYSPKGEPFSKLFNIGMIYLHGSKMSKSKGNIVSPDDLIQKYGTDALRGYELFIGPADMDSEWQVQGISGISRFLEKIYNIYQNDFSENHDADPYIEKTIQTVTNEIVTLRPNTALSHLMELINYLKKQSKISKEYAQKINILIAPFFPHLAEEIWALVGNKTSIFNAKWPAFNKESFQEINVNIAVQINGKTRLVYETDNNASKEQIIENVKMSAKIKPYLEKKNITNVIYISGKILNFVVE